VTGSFSGARMESGAFLRLKTGPDGPETAQQAEARLTD